MSMASPDSPGNQREILFTIQCENQNISGVIVPMGKILPFGVPESFYVRLVQVPLYNFS